MQLKTWKVKISTPTNDTNIHLSCISHFFSFIFRLALRCTHAHLWPAEAKRRACYQILIEQALITAVRAGRPAKLFSHHVTALFMAMHHRAPTANDYYLSIIVLLLVFWADFFFSFHCYKSSSVWDFTEQRYLESQRAYRHLLALSHLTAVWGTFQSEGHFQSHKCRCRCRKKRASTRWCQVLSSFTKLPCQKRREADRKRMKNSLSFSFNWQTSWDDCDCVCFCVCAHVCVLLSLFCKLTGRLRRLRWECQHRISIPAGGHQLGVRLLWDAAASKCVHVIRRVNECVRAFWLMCVHHKYVLVSVNVRGQCLGLLWGVGGVSVVTASAVLNCGRKRADATGVDVWHDPSQRAHRGELGAAADWVCLCVCVCVKVRKWRGAMELESEQQQQQQKKLFCQCPGTFSTTNPDFSDTQHSLCEAPPLMDTTPDFACCVTQSSPALSYLHLPFSLPPYHIPLLDLLALCWCPRAPSFPLSLHSSASPEGAFRGVKWCTACYAAACCTCHSLLPHFFISICIILFHSSSSSTFPVQQTHTETHTHLRPFLFTVPPLWVHCFAIILW